MFSKLKNDAYWLGGMLGILLPAMAYGIIRGIDLILQRLSGQEQVLEPATMVLISIFVNLFTLRYYLVNLRYDKTGRGILMLTFGLAMVYFYFLFRT
ncbi:MAG TPA: hypothetical protein P5550_06200 [Bacteroidales bacterium]|nr:hypothetical protein [Bacteroidales bacterium]